MAPSYHRGPTPSFQSPTIPSVGPLTGLRSRAFYRWSGTRCTRRTRCGRASAPTRFPPRLSVSTCSAIAPNLMSGTANFIYAGLEKRRRTKVVFVSGNGLSASIRRSPFNLRSRAGLAAIAGAPPTGRAQPQFPSARRRLAESDPLGRQGPSVPRGLPQDRQWNRLPPSAQERPFEQADTAH